MFRLKPPNEATFKSRPSIKELSENIDKEGIEIYEG